MRNLDGDTSKLDNHTQTPLTATAVSGVWRRLKSIVATRVRFSKASISAALFSLVVIVPLTLTSGAGTAWGYRHSGAAIRYLEYSQRTFDLAKRENKPVFMVISAVWCFWCKTYDEQTLEISEVASFMNRNFINVFVDLDRRQDLQHKYVTKGIPTSVIFTPDGRRYLSFSGILDPRQFLAGMSQVLADIRRQKGQPRREPAATVKNIRPFLSPSNGKAVRNTSQSLAAVFRGWRTDYLQLILDNVDMTHGGFGTGNKYPLGEVISYLIGVRKIGGPKETWLVAGHTLNLIAKHLYDSVEGGFYRYADRGDWKRLRREKMLITNVQLIRTFQMAEKMALADKNPRLAERFGGIYKNSLWFFLSTYRRDGDGAVADSTAAWTEEIPDTTG